MAEEAEREEMRRNALMVMLKGKRSNVMRIIVMKIVDSICHWQMIGRRYTGDDAKEE